MPPRDRRRARRRTPLALVAAVVAAAAILALLVGGVAEISRASGPFHQSVNQSFAQQAASVAQTSGRTGRQLTRLVDTMPSLDRLELQQSLDGLVADSESQADQAASLTPPEPSGTVGPNLEAVFAARAAAMASLRSSIDGLLGMAPLPVVGAPSSPLSGSAATGATTTLRSATEVAAQLVAVGQTLTGADTAYGRVRRQLVQAPGRARLPASRWVTDPQLWASGPVSALVDQLTSAPSLATEHAVQLLYIHLTPAVVPPPPTPSGASGTIVPGSATLPPTRTMTVTAVVVNNGGVGEVGLVVQARLQPTTAGPTALRSRRVALLPGGSAAVTLPAFRVRPGTTYVLAVSVSPPAGQLDHSDLGGALTVVVAPPSPPTTTTTTTRPPAPPHRIAPTSTAG